MLLVGSFGGGRRRVLKCTHKYNKYWRDDDKILLMKTKTKKEKPVTLILRWNPKNTTGWRGVKAIWTSESEEICSIFFSGECNTHVCSASKSQERIVQSYKIWKNIFRLNIKESCLRQPAKCTLTRQMLGKSSILIDQSFGQKNYNTQLISCRITKCNLMKIH